MSDTLSTIALAWTVARRDGATIGLTTHDRDIVIDGLVHRAAPGMTPSAIQRRDGIDADTMDVKGALTDAAIASADLLAGRWDGARVRVRAVDWSSGAVIAELGGGTIGTVERSGSAFTAELRGPGGLLDRPVAEETSPTCRADLGDKRCRVPMAPRRRLARVVSSTERMVVLDISEPSADAYRGGRLRWLAGANCGLAEAIAASASAQVTLRAPPRSTPAAGTLVEIEEGCDKTLATCTARFANAENFRGEPFLPGIDLLTRYPGG